MKLKIKFNFNSSKDASTGDFLELHGLRMS